MKTKAYKPSKPSAVLLDEADRWFRSLDGCPCTNCDKADDCHTACQLFYPFWGEKYRECVERIRGKKKGTT